MSKQKIMLIEIDATTNTFKLYGMQQLHNTKKLKARITYGNRLNQHELTDLIQRIEVYVEK